MARRPIPYLVIFLSVYSTVMFLPFLGIYYGLHEWTAENLGFGARTIAIVDTMADSPLGHIVKTIPLNLHRMSGKSLSAGLRRGEPVPCDIAVCPGEIPDRADHGPSVLDMCVWSLYCISKLNNSSIIL